MMTDTVFTTNRTRLLLLLALLLSFPPLCLAATQGSPVEITQALEEVSPLVVMITADSDDPGLPKKGTGIIVGYDQSSIYIVTANHVVWNGDEPSGNVKIDVKYANGDTAPIRNVEVMSKHEARDIGGRRGLDLAVLRVDRSRYKMPIDELRYRVIGRSGELKDQERMYTVGYADNGTQWNLNPQPERFASLNGSLLLFGTASVTPGYSGGPVFNSKFQLVGMISEDTPPNGTAITIESILSKLRDWTIPYQIAPGAGRIIISEADRNSYLLGDAIASISILLPTDSPDIKPFVDKLKADIASYSNQYPAYNNERPRELFYTSYSEQNGRRIPDSVTILTDSPYWPSYTDHPVAALVARIQTTSLHFYRSPIDPKTFDPNTRADLNMTFGANWVRYSSTERQIQSEQAAGRLELAQRMSDGSLEQFGWNLKSGRNVWATNGSISSLLDLRGGQVIISTVVGNLGNRTDLKTSFYNVVAQTRLNYINLSLGVRSITFNPDNTVRYLDKNGNPYYVFNFPKTSQEILEVFTP